MRTRTLSKIGTQLLRLRHDSTQSSQDRAAPADYGLDHRKVAEFAAGTLDAEGEAALVVGFCYEEMEDAYADVEAVEDDVGDEHEGYEPEPDSRHYASRPVAVDRDGRSLGLGP